MSARQRRYRAAKKLISIDVSAEMREVLEALRKRLRKPTDAVLKEALALLTARLDHAATGMRRRKKNGIQVSDLARITSNTREQPLKEWVCRGHTR